MTGDKKFFTVPIGLLRGLLIGEKTPKDCVQAFVDYSLYRLAVSSPQEYENDMIKQLKAAANYLNVRLSNYKMLNTNGECLYRIYTNKPFCLISTTLAWDYNDNSDRKTPHEIALFCAYCATLSIIGTSEYKKTPKSLIVARMFGYDTIAEYEKAAPSSPKRQLTIAQRKGIECRTKYANRYHIDKVLTDLELSWGLCRYSNHSRGMFISYTASLERLATICETTKRSNRVAELTARKQAARQAATKQHKDNIK